MSTNDSPSEAVIEAAADVLNEVSKRKDADYIEGGFEHEAQALAGAGLLATRSEAEIKAEALREFADTLGVNVGDDDDEDDEWWRGYRQAQRECLHKASSRADSLAPREDGR